jgi:predicted O-linked N-acetylglucosamine transferase (SPINDLY family)
LQINPESADVLANLGNTLRDTGRLAEAEDCYRRALQIRPDFVEVLSNLGVTLNDLGRQDEAEASYRRAVELNPDFAAARSNLLFYLSHNASVDAQTLFAEHCRFGEQFEAAYLPDWPQHGNPRNTERCLQIGFVSGDLRTHALASFIEPVLAHLTGYQQLSLHAYANQTIDDDTTQRLRGHFAHWHSIVGLSDAALSEQIRSDGIDILIDLSGHTAKNRLLVFARKPAPIQVSWFGYPGTTGLRAMDYFLADRFLLPPGFEDQFTEKIVRLPATGPFLPYQEAPAVSPLPALSNGHVTFGSFNRLSKLSREVIALWSQLLRALPDSRLILGGMPEEGKYATLLDWFAQEHIARERLDFHPRSDMPGYLRLYQQVDICLDTFPYNGGTTTFHAMWMGVPTLSLSGKTAAGRSGAAILGNVGLETFVADDAAEFVHKGVSWAGRLHELSAIRAGLRERMANSAAGQPQLIAASVERALRIMWQRWCAGMPADSFEVTRQEIEDSLPGADK